MREHRGIFSIPDDDPDDEAIVDNARRWELQRCLAKSPCQPTRTVQAGGDLAQVSGLRWKRKD